jgi:ribose transport system ATP-binding protein
VSHFLEEVREIAQRIVVLRDGKNVWSGKPDEIRDDELITHMVGRSITADITAQRNPAVFDEVILEASIQANPVIRHATLKLHRGEVLGIAGLVGSGRTELIKSLYGLLPITQGSMSIAGTALTRRRSPAYSISRGLGYLSEDRVIEGMIPHLSVRDNVTMTRPQDRDAARWIAALNIRPRDQFRSIRSLSGGNQQKVLLARLLHQDADVLLLDEPTRGIDVGTKAEIYRLIRDLAAQGKGILMVSSYLPELFGVCDSLAVMSRGRLSETRPISEWTPDSVLQIAIGR